MMGFIYPQLGPICPHFLQLLSVWNAMSRMCVYCVCAFLCYVSVWCVCLCVGERLVWPISPRVSTFHNTRHSDGSNTVQAPNPHRVLGDTSWRSTSQQDELQLNAVNCLQLSAVIWGSSGYFCGKIQALSEGSDCILLDGLDEHQHHNHGHCAVEKG